MAVLGLSLRHPSHLYRGVRRIAPVMFLLLLGESVFCDPLPNTALLDWEGDLAARMVAGIGTYLDRETLASVERRAQHWNRDFSSPEAYEKSVQPNRERLAKILGVVDERLPARMELVATPSDDALIAEGDGYKVYAVRWSVLPGVDGEGLLLVPDEEPVADVVALGDCDWTPEMSVGLVTGVEEAAQFPRRLAENGCRVLVPFLIDREDTYSGNPKVKMTNQPHREMVYRGAYEMGRHIIGYEVHKILAAIDWFEQDTDGERPIGVCGYGEGGLLAFYSGALDSRIDTTCVSGYFSPREQLWREPIYRNVWSLLHEFGDAEIASLIKPRGLIVEHCEFPDVDGPPKERSGRSGAAPGAIEKPSLEEVQSEVFRIDKSLKSDSIHLWTGSGIGHPGNDAALFPFLMEFGAMPPPKASGLPPKILSRPHDPEERLKRQFHQLIEHTQTLMYDSPFVRDEFWSKADAASVDTWVESTEWYREYFHEEVIGALPDPTMNLNPRTRLVYDEPEFLGYEVVLDVYPDVFAYGILLLPKDLKEGEKRPVVVCQHGLEGRPQDVSDPSVDSHYYHQFGCQLARRGFITYAPQNPYIGEDDFRVLQRKANPLKLSLFSFIVRQHERTLGWLSSLDFVDPERIGFYGLSYGGKTAMRVPAILEDYFLSICSADYNEWIWKNVSFDHKYTYLFTGEYEMFEFDLGNTFNYSEMSGLICPRPFMVERGHHDGVAPDEWVSYEFAKTFRRYDLLGIGDRAEIEIFDGPHTIHGVGTFEFLHKHLDWPAPDVRE
jgi:dienelactone hydrolase